MILFINACVRDDSRTKVLACSLLGKLGSYEEIDLNKTTLQPLNGKTLEQRTQYINSSCYDDTMFDLAKQFASADTIVIAAPYWDLSFPAILKTYLENIYVTGIVSRYGEDGRPIGLCHAEKLYYVTTAGGPYMPDFSYNYIRHLAVDCFGIGGTCLIKAEMLDVDGSDPENILCEAKNEIEKMF